MNDSVSSLHRRDRHNEKRSGLALSNPNRIMALSRHSAFQIPPSPSLIYRTLSGRITRKSPPMEGFSISSLRLPGVTDSVAPRPEIQHILGELPSLRPSWLANC